MSETSPIVEGTLEALGQGRDVLVEAGPGSGKTWTITQIAKRLEGGNNLIATYSKRLEQEISPRLPASATCSTLHRLGYRILRAHRSGVQLDPRKALGLAKEVLESLLGRRLSREERPLREELARLHDLRELTAESEVQMLGRKKAQLDFEPGLLIDALRLMAQSSLQAFEQEGRISFSEMLSLPLKLRLELPRFDLVCIDECQDLSRTALAFVRALARALGLFGDRKQAIFEFAGADVDSMDRIVQEVQPTVLHMPVSRRSSVAVVELAQRIFPGIQAMPGAPEGRVGCVPDLKQVPEGAMVLARNNKPLFTAALSLLRQGRRVRLEGRDLLGPVLAALRAVERAHGLDWERCAPALAAHYGQVEGDADLREALLLIAHLIDAGARSLEEVAAALTRQTEDPQVTLCTLHKSKGLEARDVFILLPEKYQDGAQEKQVRYVGATRAQETLNFVGTEQEMERWIAA